MKLLSMSKALSRRRLLRVNVALGLFVVLIAFAVNISGNYSSLAEIKAADSMFNMIALAGVLYSVSSLMFCIISKPQWFPGKSPKE